MLRILLLLLAQLLREIFELVFVVVQKFNPEHGLNDSGDLLAVVVI